MQFLALCMVHGHELQSVNSQKAANCDTKLVASTYGSFTARHSTVLCGQLQYQRDAVADIKVG